jgi:hypothetical protein
MNRGEIVALVKEYLNRPNLSTTSVSSMIAAVEGELNRALREHPRNRRRTTYTQPAGNAILPLPTDLAQLITLRTGRVTLRQFPDDARAQAEAWQNSYIARGDCAELFPAPASDTEFALDYVAFLRPLQGDADFNWVSTYYADLYLYGALKEAAVFLKDDQRLQAWQAEFLRRLDGVQAQGWNQNIATAPRVALVDE